MLPWRRDRRYRPVRATRRLRPHAEDRTRGAERCRRAAAAARAFRPDALTWVIVGDLSKIEAPIRKLGLGAVRVLDADGKILR